MYREMKLTSKDIEAQLARMKYTGGNKKKDTKVEKAKLPPFILAFYKLVFEFQKIPSVKLLINYYKKKYLIVTNNNELLCKYDDQEYILDKKGLEGRILRSYPSLIRDFHFFLKCSESNKFKNVIYSMSKDFFDGYDLQLEYKSKKFFICLFANTKRANFYNGKKSLRHYKNDNHKLIVLDIDLNEKAKIISDFYLYSDEHLNFLVNKIEEETKA